MTLSRYLRTRSAEICADNGCTEDEHRCESYAYIARVRGGLRLLDICAPDFFQGHSGPYAAVSRPWKGNQKALKREVREQCSRT